MAHLYCLSATSGDPDFSWFVTHKTFDKLEKCQACGHTALRRRFPVVLEFMGGKRPGDFASGTPTVLAQRSIAEELASLFKGLRLEPTLTNTGHTYHRKPLSYSGPGYVELYAPHQVEMDDGDPCVWVRRRCEICRFISIVPLGVDTPIPIPEDIRRRSEELNCSGPTIRESQLEGNSFFHFYEGLSTWCTEEVREFILGKGWSNISFVPWGHIR